MYFLLFVLAAQALTEWPAVKQKTEPTSSHIPSQLRWWCWSFLHSKPRPVWDLWQLQVEVLRQLPAASRFLIVKLSTFRSVGVFPYVALPLSSCGFGFLLFLIFHVVGSAFLQVLLAPQTKLRGRGASVKVEEHGGSKSDKHFTITLWTVVSQSEFEWIDTYLWGEWRCHSQ